MRRLAALLLLGAALGGVGAAQIELSVTPAKTHVESLVEPKTIAAGKQQTVEMLFRVRAGFHINSHTPRDKTLTATELMLEPAAGVTVGKVVYPAGREYSFSFDPKEKLDVYTGDLPVTVAVRAPRAGTYALRGTLHYQACDNAMCYPPQELPVVMEITAR